LRNGVRCERRSGKRRSAKRRFSDCLITFTTTVHQGGMREPGALANLLQNRGYPDSAARAEQVHGVRLAIVPRLSKEKIFRGADGLLTAAPDQPLAIFTADCVPVFLRAGRGQVVGVLHAGWRGVRGKILREAVRRLRRTWRLKASHVEVWTGPSIGACCFAVRWDVARHFPSTRRRSGDRWSVDLVKEIQGQAKNLGVRWMNQKASNDCTMHTRRYFSYRRDRTDRRQVSIIMKRNQP
jgi:YfiH family protein